MVLGLQISILMYIHTKLLKGLDPAKPYFDIVGEERRLQPTDAEFVDVIHTNSGGLLDAAVSLPEPVGQVDFYPNGGTHQAGCTELCIGWACIDFNLLDFFKGTFSRHSLFEISTCVMF